MKKITSLLLFAVVLLSGSVSTHGDTAGTYTAFLPIVKTTAHKAGYAHSKMPDEVEAMLSVYHVHIWDTRGCEAMSALSGISILTRSALIGGGKRWLPLMVP